MEALQAVPTQPHPGQVLRLVTMSTTAPRGPSRQLLLGTSQNSQASFLAIENWYLQGQALLISPVGTEWDNVTQQFLRANNLQSWVGNMWLG